MSESKSSELISYGNGTFHESYSFEVMYENSYVPVEKNIKKRNYNTNLLPFYSPLLKFLRLIESYEKLNSDENIIKINEKLFSDFEEILNLLVDYDKISEDIISSSQTVINKIKNNHYSCDKTINSLNEILNDPAFKHFNKITRQAESIAEKVFEEIWPAYKKNIEELIDEKSSNGEDKFLRLIVGLNQSDGEILGYYENIINTYKELILSGANAIGYMLRDSNRRSVSLEQYNGFLKEYESFSKFLDDYTSKIKEECKTKIVGKKNISENIMFG